MTFLKVLYCFFGIQMGKTLKIQFCSPEATIAIVIVGLTSNFLNYRLTPHTESVR